MSALRSISSFVNRSSRAVSHLTRVCGAVSAGVSPNLFVRNYITPLNEPIPEHPAFPKRVPVDAKKLDAKYSHKYVTMNPANKIVVLGFGAIGTGVMPLLFRHINLTPSQVLVMANEFTDEQMSVANDFKVQTVKCKLTRNDYVQYLEKHLKSGDFLINVSVDVSSVALIEWCAANGVLYIDTCNEPWAGGYSDPNVTADKRSNYAFREAALELKAKVGEGKPTALITHGANPGIVSHFVKAAIMNIAKDTNTTTKVPATREAWAELANQLNIQTIHIAERDTQASHIIKHDREFVNTWSIEGFVEEGKQPAELGWGTHEKEFPADGVRHKDGCQAAIFLDRPGATTKVRTWTPHAGIFHGYLITHTEAISIADYFTKTANGKVAYRPTVNFAYHASNDAMASMNEVAGREWERHRVERIMVSEIESGRDELGVLLMGHKKNAYWFGSDLNIDQVRAVVGYNNATSLQVCCGVISGTIWAMENPRRGIVEPEEIDYQRIITIAEPYLGTLHGKYTEWTPLYKRNILFQEKLDMESPFQFHNFRVY